NGVIEAGRDPPVLRIAAEPDPWIDEGRNDVGRAVRGRIVSDAKLQILEALAEHAIHGASDKGLVVVGGHHHADFGAGTHRRYLGGDLKRQSYAKIAPGSPREWLRRREAEP